MKIIKEEKHYCVNTCVQLFEGDGKSIDRLTLSEESSFRATDYMNNHNKLLNSSNNDLKTVNRPWCNVTLLGQKLSDCVFSFCSQDKGEISRNDKHYSCSKTRKYKHPLRDKFCIQQTWPLATHLIHTTPENPVTISHNFMIWMCSNKKFTFKIAKFFLLALP